MLLRIEDIDTGRSRPEFVDGILEDLTWLGIAWDGQIVFQSRRTELYRSALAALESLGVLYPCFCTRKDIAEATSAPHGPEGPLYPGTCRALTTNERNGRIADGRPYALRVDVEKARARTGPLVWTDRALGRQLVEVESFGDFVVARKDAPASYNLCVVVDDADQRVTLVTRGEDLVPATGPQRLLQALLGLQEPDYLHHRLLVRPDGQKLSKRDGAVTVARLRSEGLSAQDVLDLAFGGT